MNMHNTQHERYDTLGTDLHASTRTALEFGDSAGSETRGVKNLFVLVMALVKTHWFRPKSRSMPNMAF